MEQLGPKMAVVSAISWRKSKQTCLNKTESSREQRTLHVQRFLFICNQEVIHLFTERGCQLSLRNSTFRQILVEFHVPRSLCVLGDMEVAVMIFIRVVSESRFL